MSFRYSAEHWALIVGGSSGLGLASALKLARHGMNIAVVHRDRRGAMSRIEPYSEEIRQSGVGFRSWNLDGTLIEGRDRVLAELEAQTGKARVRVLLHSIAFGNLKPMVNKGMEQEFHATLGDEDFQRTVYAMGLNLATWTQGVFDAGLFTNPAQVLGFTSEGSQRNMVGYAAVSAAKGALETISRSIAVEYGPHGLRSNIVQAGVTDTPALRLIPRSARLLELAKQRNPLGRGTLPSDVANAVALLCTDEANWINGTIVRVDGGEFVAGDG